MQPKMVNFSSRDSSYNKAIIYHTHALQNSSSVLSINIQRDRSMQTRKILPLLALLLLSACNLPNRPIQPSSDHAIETQVSQLLTTQPTTPAPPVITATPEAPQPAANTATIAVPATTAPTPTNIPSFTPVPTRAQPAPTLPSGDPRNSLGAPTWHDSLETAKAFYLYENDNTKVTQDNGALVLTGKLANGWMGWSLTFSHPATNFYIEATFTPQQCSGTDLYGLVFRSPSTDAGYFFGVTCDGRYNLHARDFKENTDTTLVELTANSAIQAGSNQTNRLGILANGDKLGLYANGILLDEITDSTYSAEGDFGALVAANETPDFSVHMEEISLWKLP